jgi:hypothetical protein
MACMRITIKLNPVGARCAFQDRLFFLLVSYMYPVGQPAPVSSKQQNRIIVTTQDSAIRIMYVAGTFDYSYSNQQYAPMCSNHHVITIRMLETRTVSFVQAKGKTEQDLLWQAAYPNKYVRCFQ